MRKRESILKFVGLLLLLLMIIIIRRVFEHSYDSDVASSAYALQTNRIYSESQGVERRQPTKSRSTLGVAGPLSEVSGSRLDGALDDLRTFSVRGTGWTKQEPFEFRLP